MESFLKENFDYPAKNSSEEVHLRWRRAVGMIVLNRKRRFRMVADLDKRSEGEKRRRSIQIMEIKLNHTRKEKEKSYIHWTAAMDCTLSAALLEQLYLGNKGANGWKGVAFTAAITAMFNECQVHISKEKIMARLKTWNKYYHEISAMLETSGFGWDWDRHVVQVDSEDVWENYIKAHPSLKHYKDKVIVNWGDLAALCGTDRATGANAATGVEAANEIEVEEILDDDVVEDSSRRKKMKKTSAMDMIAAAVTHIAKNIDGPTEMEPMVQPVKEKTRIERMYEALALMPELSEYDLIKAMDMLSTDEIKCEVFLVLPELLRKSWLRLQIGN